MRDAVETMRSVHTLPTEHVTDGSRSVAWKVDCDSCCGWGAVWSEQRLYNMVILRAKME